MYYFCDVILYTRSSSWRIIARFQLLLRRERESRFDLCWTYDDLLLLNVDFLTSFHFNIFNLSIFFLSSKSKNKIDIKCTGFSFSIVMSSYTQDPPLGSRFIARFQLLVRRKWWIWFVTCMNKWLFKTSISSIIIKRRFLNFILFLSNFLI